MEKINEQHEEVNSLVKSAIVNEGKLRINSVYLKKVKISKVERLNVYPCKNHDSNYRFTGCVTVVKYIETDNGNDTHEFPQCEISGYVMVEDDKVSFSNGISIDKGFTLANMN